MKKILYLLVILIFSIQINSVSAQEETEKNVFITYTNYPSEKDNINDIQIFIMVSYDKLKFTRIKDGYEADYDFSIDLIGESSDQNLQKYWNDRIVSQNYLETRSTTKYVFGNVSYSVSPGKYQIHFEATDRNTGKSISNSMDINLESFWKEALKISDIYYFGGEISSFNNTVFFSPPSMIACNYNSGFTAAYKCFSEKTNDILNITWTVKSGTSNRFEAISGKKTAEVNNHIFTGDLFFDSATLKPGNYVLEIEIENKSGKRSRIRSSFSLLWFDRPFSDRDIAVVFQQMKIIPSFKKNFSHWINLPADTLSEKILNYWKKRDPGSTGQFELMKEFLFRADYSLQHFSSWNFPGWTSDRGRILILYGIPLNRQRDYNSPGRPPYEIWIYDNLDRQFVFVDTDRNGIFQLKQIMDRAGNSVF